MAKNHDEDIELNETDPTLDDAPVQAADDLQERVDDLTASLQRVQAEFVNYKRRADLERAETMDFAKSRVVREFLSVRDSFDQEQAHRPEGVDAKWAASIDSIRAQFDKSLKNLGVEKFESVGHAFDPHRHEAVMMAEGDGAHEVVVEELQAGYGLGETVLRHAMVRVGRSDEAPRDAKAADEAVATMKAEQQEPDEVQPEAGE